ncbi:MAG: hypothetical protein ONB44_07585 [candidate division KSB1 bacterium]|nr:hypothetical protein [candidate division KSB1 bacterium]MDZ7301988.1 hypothetical protein [candidate division KSB1 bacterium]MDZ7310170.1 hypothetical protein [candidate division KSB1 bacterium]
MFIQPIWYAVFKVSRCVWHIKPSTSNARRSVFQVNSKTNSNLWICAINEQRIGTIFGKRIPHPFQGRFQLYQRFSNFVVAHKASFLRSKIANQALFRKYFLPGNEKLAASKNPTRIQSCGAAPKKKKMTAHGNGLHP